MKLIATLLFGGTLFAADLPNPEVGACVIADAVVTRSEPTMIDPDGAVTGMRIWQVCSFQHPTDTGGMRTVDDSFVTEIDLEGVDPDMADAAAEVLRGD